METELLKRKVDGLCDMIETLCSMLDPETAYSSAEREYQVLIAMELVKNIRESA